MCCFWAIFVPSEMKTTFPSVFIFKAKFWPQKWVQKWPQKWVKNRAWPWSGSRDQKWSSRVPKMGLFLSPFLGSDQNPHFARSGSKTLDHPEKWPDPPNFLRPQICPCRPLFEASEPGPGQIRSDLTRSDLTQDQTWSDQTIKTTRSPALAPSAQCAAGAQVDRKIASSDFALVPRRIASPSLSPITCSFWPESTKMK